jgi:hypothetical protein
LKLGALGADELTPLEDMIMVMVGKRARRR